MIRRSFDISAVEPFWHRLRFWWSERSLREQLLLGALAAIAVFGLLLLILAPLREARMEALADIRNASLLEARLRAGGPGLGQSFRTGTASAIVTNSTAAAQLQVQQIEPQGNGVRVGFTGVPFDALMGWIADVETTSNLRMQDVSIERQGAAGYVDATIVLGE